MPHSILIVEKDIDLQEYLQTTFIETGYHVFCAKDGTTALKILKKILPDIVLLDIQLSDISGETVCVEIKKQYPCTSVIFLTAINTSAQIIHGLTIGADDYIIKPFVIEELLCRIKVQLRQKSKGIKKILQIADLALNIDTHQVTRNGKQITLTPKEFKLLAYLMKNQNQLITREQMLNTIWNYNKAVESRIIDIYVGMLRKKIDNSCRKKLIHCVRGFGYMLKDS